MKQIIEEPTRIGLTKSSLLDHIYTNSFKNISNLGVIETSISDHSLIFIIRKVNYRTLKIPQIITYRSQKDMDTHKMLMEPHKVSFDKIYSSEVLGDTNHAILEFSNILADIYNILLLKQKEFKI